MSKKLIPALLLVGLISSCAKEKPYDEVAKTADLQFASALQTKKALLDMCSADDPCLYLPSVTNTPSEVTASRPFWQGEQRLVVANLDTKDKLQFLQVEPGEKTGNINNLSPVLNIEVEHVDYKCAEDEFGDCTNKEEVDTDKDWSQRRFVKIKDVQVVETNTLPIEFGEMFGEGCFTETAKVVQKLEIEKNAINVVVKKTYKNGIKCSNVSTYEELMEQIRYFNFTVDYSYSIVKLSSLKDKTYKAVDYPKVDESTFGFFTTNLKTKTVDNHDHYMGLRKSMANRWSPNKKEVVYYLSEEFDHPELKSIKASTVNAIRTVNASLKKANTDVQIVLKKGNNEEIGDLRKNYIILVKDPQASGVIGYGPSVTNPNTGEIVNARTVMYYGTIQKFVSRAYDELLEEVIENLRSEQEQTQQNNPAQANNVAATSGSAATAQTSFRELFNSKDPLSLSNYIAERIDLNNVERAFNNPQTEVLINTDEYANLSQKELQLKLSKEFRNRIENNKDAKESLIDKLSKETFYHGSQVDYAAIVMRELRADIDAKREVGFWDDLSEEKRKYFMDKLLPYVWVPTLVHEFGHNLGLRHNFYGSTDTENFYSKDEVAGLGMRKEVTYSSIMDYAPKTNNELSVMGKYDIAALRFAYAREVETKDGSIVKIPSTIKELGDVALKPYKYCSDEHVSTNPLCNRHDEGTTYEEVIDYHIGMRTKYYEKRNFRNRKYNFESRSGDWSYLIRTFNTYIDIYQFFSQYDQYKANGSYDKENWQEDKSLVSLKKAADKAFAFFMDTIEEPAYNCIKLNDKYQIVEIAPFTEMAVGTKLASFGITFDIKHGCLLLNQYGREGEDFKYAAFGKYFNNSLDLLYDRTQMRDGDSSQIDVRGMWIDKLISTYLIGARFTSPTTVGAASSGNFFDYPEYNKRLKSTLNGILTNTMTKEVEVTLPNGAKTKAVLPFTFESSHKVNKSYNPYVNGFSGLYGSQTNLKSIMMDLMKRQLLSDRSEAEVDSEDSLTAFYAFDVDRVSTRVDLARYKYDKVVQFENAAGKVNYRFGLYEYNTKGMELAKLKDTVDMLSIASKENIEMAQVVASNKVLEYLVSLTKYKQEDIMKLVECQLTDECITNAGLLTEEEVKEVLALETPNERIVQIIGYKKFSEAELSEMAKLPTQIEILAAAAVQSKEDLAEIKEISRFDQDAVNGFLSGTLTDQVLLSSFIALSK